MNLQIKKMVVESLFKMTVFSRNEIDICGIDSTFSGNGQIKV